MDYPVWADELDALRLTCAPALRLFIGAGNFRLYRLTTPKGAVIEQTAVAHRAPGKRRCRLYTGEPSSTAGAWRTWTWGEPGAPVAAPDLALAQIAPTRHVLDGLLPKGLVILAGKHKEGKSWLILQWAVAIARGEQWAGRPTEGGPVVYCSLEDDWGRLRDRLATITKTQPPDLHTQNDMETGDIGLQQLEQWAERYRPIMLVVDTLQKWRGGRASTYARDYKDAGQFKRLADDHGASLVIVHHTRKGAASHPLDAVSGSTGLTGAADAVLVLARQGDQGALYATGKDIAEQTLPLRWIGQRWYAQPPSTPRIGIIEPRKLTYRP